MININRRGVLTTAASLLAMPSLLQAAPMTRSEEQVAAKAAAKMVAEETGEKPHSGAGAILTLPATISLMDGTILNSRDYASKVLILYFWASWCPICKVVGPRLQTFWQTHRSEGIELLSIATQDAVHKTKASINQRQYRFPVAKATDLRLPSTFKTRNLPTIMLRSKLGVIVTIEEGDISADEMKEFLVHV
jgi:thiol-disulfide isomerase/thioredoxin